MSGDLFGFTEKTSPVNLAPCFIIALISLDLKFNAVFRVNIYIFYWEVTFLRFPLISNALILITQALISYNKVFEFMTSLF